LEETLARIDAPRLNELDITFFNEIVFETPKLLEFICRTPMLWAPKKGHITFDSGAVIVKFPSQTSTSDYGGLTIQILCTTSDWQLSSLEQVCNFPPLSTLEDLYILEDSFSQLHWQDDVENGDLWLKFFRLFTAVKNLYLGEEFAPRIAPALQELVRGRTTEVLPILENIILKGFQPSGPLHEGIEKFVAARRLTSRPVAVSRWDEDSE